MFFEIYKISWIYHLKTLAIGCRQYTFDEFENFSDEQISTMDNGALDWWKKYKKIIFEIINL